MDRFVLRLPLLPLLSASRYYSKRLEYLKFTGSACDINDKNKLWPIRLLFVLFTMVFNWDFCRLGGEKNSKPSPQ